MQIRQRYCTIPCLRTFSSNYNPPLSKRNIHSLTWPTKCVYKGFKGAMETTCDKFWPFNHNIQSIILFPILQLECLIAPVISLLCTKKASHACVKRCAPGKCSNFVLILTTSLWQVIRGMNAAKMCATPGQELCSLSLWCWLLISVFVQISTILYPFTTSKCKLLPS